MFKIINIFFLVSIFFVSAAEKCEKSKDESVFKGYQNSVVIPLVVCFISVRFGYFVDSQQIAKHLSLVGYYGTRLYLCNTIIPINWTQAVCNPSLFDCLIYYNREEIRKQEIDFQARRAFQRVVGISKDFLIFFYDCAIKCFKPNP